MPPSSWNDDLLALLHSLFDELFSNEHHELIIGCINDGNYIKTFNIAAVSPFSQWDPPSTSPTHHLILAVYHTTVYINAGIHFEFRTHRAFAALLFRTCFGMCGATKTPQKQNMHVTLPRYFFLLNNSSTVYSLTRILIAWMMWVCSWHSFLINHTLMWLNEDSLRPRGVWISLIIPTNRLCSINYISIKIPCHKPRQSI